MRSSRIRVLSLTALTILLFSLLGINSSISLADHMSRGLIVPMKINTSLSSHSSRTGQTWTATVFQDVYDGNAVVIPRGSVVEGSVTTVDSADRFNGSGKIGVDFNRVVLPNGNRIDNIDAMLTSLDAQMRSQIDEEQRSRGGSSFKQNVYFIGGGNGQSVLIGSIAGGSRGSWNSSGDNAISGTIRSALSQGQDVEIPSGTEFAMVILTQINVPVFTGTTTNQTPISLSRSDITALQKELRNHSYNPGPINGVFTSATRKALINFQDDNNLSKTGRLDSATIDALGLNLSMTAYGEGRYRDIDPNGSSSYTGDNLTHRFIIWRDGYQWHVRTTTAGNSHNFTGRIVANVSSNNSRFGNRNRGRINSIKRIGLEDADEVSRDYSSRAFRLNRGNLELSFNFTTAGAMDGVDFSSDADTLTFDLSMDGRNSPQNVYIGRNGRNPASIPFTLANQ